MAGSLSGWWRWCAVFVVFVACSGKKRNFTDEAYWQDVLDVRYAGFTDSFTLVNAAFGVRWLNNRFTTSIKVTNLGNQEVQQHVFGDIMKRQVVGEVRVGF